MNFNYLNRFFTKKNIFLELMTENFERAQFLRKISENYSKLNDEYRNEFFYKNTIFNKVVLGRYSLSTTVAFSELNIAKSKADYVVINGSKGIVYEIKTDLDNLDRLVFQVMDYTNVFSEVYVVTSEKNYYPVYKALKEADVLAGILVMTKDGRLSVRKKTDLNDENLNHEILFKLLRKNEYESILKYKFKKLPQVRQVEYYKESLNRFKTIEVKEAQKLVFKQLWKREALRQSNLLKKVPYEIRWLVYKELTKEEDLVEILNKLGGS